MGMTNGQLIFIHDLSTRNKLVVTNATRVGCFYCKKIYPASEVVEFSKRNDSAICPHCSIDAVLPEYGSFVPTEEILNQMYQYWFANTTEMKS